MHFVTRTGQWMQKRRTYGTMSHRCAFFGISVAQDRKSVFLFLSNIQCRFATVELKRARLHERTVYAHRLIIYMIAQCRKICKCFFADFFKIVTIVYNVPKGGIGGLDWSTSSAEIIVLSLECRPETYVYRCIVYNSFRIYIFYKLQIWCILGV